MTVPESGWPAWSPAPCGSLVWGPESGCLNWARALTQGPQVSRGHGTRRMGKLSQREFRSGDWGGSGRPEGWSEDADIQLTGAGGCALGGAPARCPPDSREALTAQSPGAASPASLIRSARPSVLLPQLQLALLWPPFLGVLVTFSLARPLPPHCHQRPEQVLLRLGSRGASLLSCAVTVHGC